jgi:hypothetical protein
MVFHVFSYVFIAFPLFSFDFHLFLLIFIDIKECSLGIDWFVF